MLNILRVFFSFRKEDNAFFLEKKFSQKVVMFFISKKNCRRVKKSWGSVRDVSLKIWVMTLIETGSSS